MNDGGFDCGERRCGGGTCPTSPKGQGKAGASSEASRHCVGTAGQPAPYLRRGASPGEQEFEHAGDPDCWVPESPVAALLSWRRRLWRTPFGRFFFRLQQSTLACQRTETSSRLQEETHPIFPCPLPYADALEAPSARDLKSFEARRVQRRWGSRFFVNLVIGLCNFYALGSPTGRLDVVFSRWSPVVRGTAGHGAELQEGFRGMVRELGWRDLR